MPAEPTYTYSSNPATDDKDAVRALISDVGAGGVYLISDEEILFALAEEGDRRLAGAMCAEMIAGKFTGPTRNITSKKVGDLARASGGARSGADDWYELARTLRRRASRGAIPMAGGVEVDDREDRTDRSLLQPQFKRGMDDFSPSGRNDLDGVDAEIAR